MSKAIFFGVPTSGHVNPTLPVVAELVARGEDVIYYLTEGFREKIEATGAMFRAYELIDDDYFDANGLDGSNPPKTMAIMSETCKSMLPRLAEIVKEEAPDYLLYDAMCPWGWQTAQFLNIPSVSSMSLLALTPGLLIRSGFLFKMAGAVLKNLRYVRQFRRFSQEMKRVYGIPALGLVDFLNVQGTITINYTSKLFQPGGKSMPESVKFVGPSIKARDDAGNFPFDDFNDDPLVYISLGTVINQNTAFFERCMSAFRDVDYRVVMSVGEKISIKSFEIPSNFIVRNHVPQLDVLKRSAVFITHAGMNSVQEGLYFGVPLVLVPQQTEQSFVALRAEPLGVGVRLEGEITADRLRRAVKQILEHPRYSEQAKKIGTSLREAGGYQRAVDEIFAFKQAHGL